MGVVGQQLVLVAVMCGEVDDGNDVVCDERCELGGCIVVVVYAECVFVCGVSVGCSDL